MKFKVVRKCIKTLKPKAQVHFLFLSYSAENNLEPAFVEAKCAIAFRQHGAKLYLFVPDTVPECVPILGDSCLGQENLCLKI